MSINKISKKQAVKNREYNKICKTIDELHRDEEGYVRCWFSGERILGKVDHHHVFGRDGDLMTNPDYIKPVSPKYHAYQYHSYTYQQLILTKWYLKWLDRIKDEIPELYAKEMMRKDKSL